MIEHTDIDHPKSTVELIQMLRDCFNINVSRNTICNDLIVLRNSNLDIECIETTQNKYFYDGRPFDVCELKILIDALSAAKFISNKMSKELIAKLLTLTTEESALQLNRNISVDGYIKSNSRSGYYSVDTLNNAINLKRKVSFRYTDFDVRKKRYITNFGEKYTLSPYELIWDGNYYYVRGYCDERKGLRTFRLDRIEEHPILLNDIAVIESNNYNSKEFHRTVFGMFDTVKPIQVELRCHVCTMKYLIDNFGDDFASDVIDENTFKANVYVCPSSTFYRWIFGFGGNIKILGPERIVEEFKDLLRKELAYYDK